MPGNGVPVGEKKEGEEGGSGKQQLVRLGEKREERADGIAEPCWTRPPWYQDRCSWEKSVNRHEGGRAVPDRGLQRKGAEEG